MTRDVVLIPTYNERENIALLVPEIFAHNKDLSVMVIDDASPDGTGDEVRKLMQRYPNLSILSRPGKQGLGTAYKEAMSQVLHDPSVSHVITMDADGSHSAEDLNSLLAATNDHELVIGSRYVKGGGIEDWEPWRFALSKYGNLYARTVTGLPIRDLTAGFMCFSAPHLRQIDFSRMQASGYAFLMEIKFAMVYTLGGRVTEVPITFKSRREGESKISKHIIREGLKTPWRLFTRRLTEKQKKLEPKKS